MSTKTVSVRARDIQEINRLYWQSLRELALENAAEAALRFGVSQDVAERIRECSLGDLSTLASASLMQFRAKKLDLAIFDDMTDPDARLRQLARGL
ncbi:hypothetical protein T35B1_11787 [Salinisphaera shabanensis T35B1]|uniref:flagellar transcriptional regulator FlhD n=1 Tax=Salinisphaera TaxID=180541 RepID=UPI0033405C3C